MGLFSLLLAAAGACFLYGGRVAKKATDYRKQPDANGGDSGRTSSNDVAALDGGAGREEGRIEDPLLGRQRRPGSSSGGADHSAAAAVGAAGAPSGA